MTLKEAVRFISPMSLDEAKAHARDDHDAMLSRVVSWRAREREAYAEIHLHVCGVPPPRLHGHGLGVYGRPKATIVAVRARMARESSQDPAA